MASRFPLNLPNHVKEEVAQLAKQQGISLNQFIVWAVVEKVAELKTSLDDPRFPQVTYRRGDGGLTPVVRGTGIRVQTLVISHFHWGESAESLAKDYGISELAVLNALAFYEAHKVEIDNSILIEKTLEENARHAKTAP